MDYVWKAGLTWTRRPGILDCRSGQGMHNKILFRGRQRTCYRTFFGGAESGNLSEAALHLYSGAFRIAPAAGEPLTHSEMKPDGRVKVYF